jgi:glyoxylase-like metal-dependent hydrolase (beta-lactamase superfamily II)
MELNRIGLSVTNDYLFRNGDKYVLVDTGYEADWELFKERLGATGIGPGDISHLILTHHHDDHAGFIHELLEENPAIVVVMSAWTRELLLAGRNDASHGGGLINRRIAFLIRFKGLLVSSKTGKKVKPEDNLLFKPYATRSTDLVLSGETRLVDLGIGAEGSIIPTPGHTVDSASILFDDGDCLVGDAAASMLLLAGTRHCVIFVMDLRQYYESWRLLLARGAKRIFPAHGRSFSATVLEREMGKNRQEDIVLYRP